jgi:membrane protein implicated in regulation of membrane protease activity
MLESAQPEILWFLAGLVIMLAEFIIPGFVVIFFGFGAWVTAAGALAGIVSSFNSQLILWLLSSVLLLVLFRRKGTMYFRGKVTGRLKTGASIDDIAGERVVVTAAIDPQGIGGKVEFHGTQWEATADVPIAKGAVAEVVGRDNLMLKVKPV